MVVPFLFNLLVFLLPLVFFPMTSELFEFNKIVLIYVFTILICAAWAWEAVKAKKFIFRNTALTVPIAALLLSQILATLFSIDMRTSIFGYYGRFHGGLLSSLSYAVLYFAFVTFMDRRLTLGFVRILLVSTGIAAAYAAFEHFGYSPSCLIITGELGASCFVQDVQARVFGTFGQPNWLAAFLVAVMPLVWAKVISNLKSQKSKLQLKNQNFIKYFLLFSVLFLTLLFTKSRSGMLGFLVAFVIFWLPNIKKHFSTFTLTTFFLLLATSFIWNPFSPNTEPPVPGVTESGDIRKIVWRGAIDLWKKYPVLGTGVETFAYSYYETRPVEHNKTSEWNHIYNKAHNEYLNFAATTGAVGLASYLLLNIFSIKQIFNFKGQKSKVKIKTQNYKLKNFFDLSCGFEVCALRFAFLAGYVSILVTNFFGFSTTTSGLLLFLFPAMAQSLELESKRVEEFKSRNLNSIRKLAILILCSFTLLLLYSVSRYWLADYNYANGYPERAVLLSPNEPAYRLALAEHYAAAGDFEKASGELLTLERLAPRNIKLIKSAANVYGEMGLLEPLYYEEENRLFADIARYAPTDASLYYQLGRSYAKLGDIERARGALETAVKLKDDYREAIRLLFLL